IFIFLQFRYKAKSARRKSLIWASVAELSRPILLMMIDFSTVAIASTLILLGAFNRSLDKLLWSIFMGKRVGLRLLVTPHTTTSSENLLYDASDKMTMGRTLACRCEEKGKATSTKSPGL
ncbi:MAG: hypothetical protein ONA90_05935, partial [candidate division KSB1 bacterium]|nr:hypothetical protein [candidate division KSB1 bacterium]